MKSNQRKEEKEVFICFKRNFLKSCCWIVIATLIVGNFGINLKTLFCATATKFFIENLV